MAEVGQRFTSGTWTVKEGSEDEFISRWTEFTTWALKNSPGAEFFYLIRRDDDSRRFVSFGAWSDRDAVDAWRSSPEFAEMMGRCRALCDEFSPQDSTLVATPNQ